MFRPCEDCGIKFEKEDGSRKKLCHRCKLIRCGYPLKIIDCNLTVINQRKKL